MSSTVFTSKLLTVNRTTGGLLLVSLIFATFAHAAPNAGARRFQNPKPFRQQTAETNSKKQIDDEQTAIAQTKILVEEVIGASFPELAKETIEIKTFRGKASYFRASFSFARFFFAKKLRYKIFVNLKVFERSAPPEALRAIVAHELSHLLYYQRRNRFELLGLVALVKSDFIIRFERAADLETINRGYANGLIAYRSWLYRNIPDSKIAGKKLIYFTPEEINLLADALRQKPALLEFWRKNVPRDAAAIKTAFGKLEP